MPRQQKLEQLFQNLVAEFDRTKKNIVKSVEPKSWPRKSASIEARQAGYLAVKLSNEILTCSPSNDLEHETPIASYCGLALANTVFDCPEKGSSKQLYRSLFGSCESAKRMSRVRQAVHKNLLGSSGDPAAQKLVMMAIVLKELKEELACEIEDPEELNAWDEQQDEASLSDLLSEELPNVQLGTAGSLKAALDFLDDAPEAEAQHYSALKK